MYVCMYVCCLRVCMCVVSTVHVPTAPANSHFKLEFEIIVM